MNRLIIELMDDGSVKTDARKMSGDDKQILEQLNELAREVGGALEIERHEHIHKHVHANKNRERTKA